MGYLDEYVCFMEKYKRDILLTVHEFCYEQSQQNLPCKKRIQ
jgi:hypothetical protein